jgi:20S proteasome subunit alpha 4
VEDPPTVEYMARFMATIQQRYTQRGGRRPFGISLLVAGHDTDGSPKLYQTDPAGTYSAWKANAVGRQAKTLREFLESKYEDDMSVSRAVWGRNVRGVATLWGSQEAECIDLATRALLEVVESGAKSIEIAVLRASSLTSFVPSEDIEAIATVVESEAAAATSAASAAE